MSEYKLHYFNLRGRAEQIRWIFKYAGVEFEDVRVAGKDWPELKQNCPFGQMPLLIEANGFQLAQSISIERYLAKKFGLAGKTPEEIATAEMIVDGIMDMMALYPWSEGDQAKKEIKRKEALEQGFPKQLKFLEQLLSRYPGDYFLESGISWCDIHFAAGMNFMTEFKADLLSDSPKLKKLYEVVTAQEAIKAWIAQRPKTSI